MEGPILEEVPLRAIFSRRVTSLGVVIFELLKMALVVKILLVVIGKFPHESVREETDHHDCQDVVHSLLVLVVWVLLGPDVQ